MKYDVIVIGAGAAGLMAASELLAAGRSVCLLEAAAAAGGRIATHKEPGFDIALETGAEFVHGELLLTLDLLHKAGISYLPVEGKMIAVQNGKWLQRQAHDRHWPEFMHRLKKLRMNTSIEQFLQQEFGGDKYATLRDAVTRYAEGFDLADTKKASALAAGLEWGQEEETQYRIPGGYCQLIDFLLERCRRLKADILFNARVTSVAYDTTGVHIQVKGAEDVQAAKAVITVSAGMLQSGMLSFQPALDTQYSNAISQLGFGNVIKLLLQFRDPFWKNNAPDAGFLLSDEIIPTWWTQLPRESNLLTGWLGGPAATAKSGESTESLLQMGLQSLSGIFDLPIPFLQQQLQQHRICCWQHQPYSRGGYSYVTVNSAAAKKLLSHPVAQTLYFSGEAMYRGQSQGTVEAALQSGREVADSILRDA